MSSGPRSQITTEEELESQFQFRMLKYGSSIGRLSNWRYTGRYFRRFVGNSYLSGHGWTRKYRTGYQYKREQFKVNYYNEFYK